WEILIWRMRPTIRQRQTEQQRFHAEYVPEIRDDRNAAAFANERWVLVKRFLQRALRRFAKLAVRIGQIPRAVMTALHVQLHSRGTVFFRMFLPEIDNHVGVLIWNEPERQFRHRVTWQNGFRSRPLITTAHAINLRRRPRPDSLQRAESRFAKKRWRLCFIEHFGIGMDRKIFPGLALPILQRHHVIKKAWNCNPAIPVVQTGKQFRQSRSRVRNRATKN